MVNEIPSSAMSSSLRQNILFLGLTTMLVGYFMPWLPGPAAGLQIIALEFGEWIKFLGVGVDRNWFYFPPIAMGAIVALLAALWPNDHWRIWLARLLAIAVSMLSFPAIAAIQLEPRSEWLYRLVAIGVVAAIAVGGSLVRRDNRPSQWLWLAIALISLAGGLLPTLQYFRVLPVVEEIMKQDLGAGIGVWLNLAGALLVSLVALLEWRRMPIKKDSH